MHFDDMLTTVMAAEPRDGVARQVVWRQLVDILAQERRGSDPALHAAALTQLGELRRSVSPVVRASVARAVAPRTNNPALVRYFAQDDPVIAAEVLRHAQLSDAQWCSLIGEIPTSSRALLRERRDLSLEVTAALSAFGAADYALAAPQDDVAGAAQQPGITAIADVVARIEAFRARKAQVDASSHPSAQDEGFTLETDATGQVIFTTAEPRAALIGLNLSVAGESWLCGVDGYAAGAVNGRSAFAGARLMIAGTSPLAGDWRLAGAPMFEPASGRFEGYRCTARRPRPDEVAHASPGPTQDSLRQMVHELRTPLNAIIGFAEMIERELLGPVRAPYREQAASIRSDGLKLLAAFEDIDLSARLDATPDINVRPGTVADIATLLTLFARDVAPLTNARQLHLRVSRPVEPCAAIGEQASLHRLLSRVVTLGLASGQNGDAFALTATRNDGLIRVTISRVHTSVGATADAQSADTSLHAPTHDDTVLGTAFALRLIEKLATSMGVKFMSDGDAFGLILRVAQDSAAEPNRTLHRHDDERLPS